MQNATKIPVHECLTCGHKLTAATSVSRGKRKPEKGDFGICIECGKPSQFDENLNMKPLTQEQLLHLRRENYEIWLKISTAQAFINERNKAN